MLSRVKLGLLVLLFLCTHPAQSMAGRAFNTLTLRSSRSTLLADGKQSADVIAEVRDSSGRIAGNGVNVQFQTTLGTLSQQQSQTFSGIARVRLTSSQLSGLAHVTAFSTGGGNAVLDLLFTSDPQDLFQGNTFMQIGGSSYLAYSATDRVVEAQGKNGGSHITYRNIELTADRLQLNCDDNIVRAHDNIVLKRGNHTLHATRLFYSLQTGQGYAIADLNSRLQTVIISGENLIVQPSPTPIPSSYIMFPTLQVKLVVVANSITYFPGDKLQFRRPKFYQDQTQIMSLPYYELPLNSEELFSDQFVSVGTHGLGLELPFYYNLTPKSTGILYLRHQQQLGRSYYSTNPGWGLDMIQGYNSLGEKRYDGSFGFTGITRGDWGFRWNHNQEFNSTSQGSFYFELPQHQSLISSANFNQQLRYYRWGANFSGGQTLTSLRATSLRSEVYAETQPHKLSNSRSFLYTLGTNISTGSSTSKDALVGNTSETTEDVIFRAFTRPIPIDKRTTLTNSFSLGNVWSSGTALSGASSLATLALDHTFAHGGAVNLTYDYVAQPGGLYISSGKHRLSVNYNVATNRKIEVVLFGSTFLDSSDSSVLADLSYRLDKQWRLLTGVTLQKYGGESYRDVQFTLGRRIGTRELQFTYSTLNRRLSLDLTATRF